MGTGILCPKEQTSLSISYGLRVNRKLSFVVCLYLCGLETVYFFALLHLKNIGLFL